MYYEQTIMEMQLSGGVGCLDFINSASDTEDGQTVERLNEYTDLLILAERTDLLTTGIIKSLHLNARKNPAEAQRILTNAKRCRQLLLTVLTAVATKKTAALDNKTLAHLNKVFRQAASRRGFRLAGKQLVENWELETVHLSLPLDAFLISAFDLLKSDRQQYIRKCAACDWLFLDKSKSHRRKWCDMQTCGSSVKSKRYYEKRKREEQD